MINSKILKKLQIELDKAEANIQSAKTSEEKIRACEERDAVSAVMNAYLFTPDEMELLS